MERTNVWAKRAHSRDTRDSGDMKSETNYLLAWTNNDPISACRTHLKIKSAEMVKIGSGKLGDWREGVGVEFELAWEVDMHRRLRIRSMSDIYPPTRLDATHAATSGYAVLANEVPTRE